MSRASSDVARQQRLADEHAVRANPPPEVSFTFDRYSGAQLSQLNSAQPNARDVDVLLILKNPGRSLLPLTRVMLKEMSPQLPNIWNFGAGLAPCMNGIMIPIGEDTFVKSEASFFEKTTTALTNIGMPADGITLSAVDSEAPLLSVSISVATSLLTAFTFMRPPDPVSSTAPVMLTPPRQSAVATLSLTPPASTAAAVDGVSREEHERLMHQVSNMDSKLDALIASMAQNRPSPQSTGEPNAAVIGAPVIPLDGVSAPANATAVIQRRVRSRRD